MLLCSKVGLIFHVLVYHVLLLDVPAIVYAYLVVEFVFAPEPSLVWPLRVAKYQGFLINLATTYLWLTVMRNVRKATYNWLTWPRVSSIIEYHWRWPRLLPIDVHAHYSYRMFVAAGLHTLAHVLFTHKYRLLRPEQVFDNMVVYLNSIPSQRSSDSYNSDDYDDNNYDNDRLTIEQLLRSTDTPTPLILTPDMDSLTKLQLAQLYVYSFVYDSHTWTGYVLLASLLMMLLPTGIRLLRRAAKHVQVFALHRIVAAAVVVLQIVHHPIYFWPTLWIVLLVVDYLLGTFMFTEKCVVRRVQRYPNYQLEDADQRNDVIDLEFVYSSRKMEQFTPGDYVRVRLREISRWEWHDFTLMKCEQSSLLSCPVHLIVRSVGTWTRRLYTSAQADATVLEIKGPYSMSFYDPLLNRLVRTCATRFNVALDRQWTTFLIGGSSNNDDSIGVGVGVGVGVSVGLGSAGHSGDNNNMRSNSRIATTTTTTTTAANNMKQKKKKNTFGSPTSKTLGFMGAIRLLCCCGSTAALDAIEMPRTLVLVCTGTAITHFLSLLDTIVPLYYNGYRATELPQKIVLSWTIRTIFNLNFALLPLYRYQQILQRHKIHDLLTYEFFVSQKPASTDALSAQMIRRMVVAVHEYEDNRCRGNLMAAEPYNDHDETVRSMLRYSRLSHVDLTNQRNTKTVLGAKINYQEFGQTYLSGGSAGETLLMVNSSVRGVTEQFCRLAKQYGCRIHVDSL